MAEFTSEEMGFAPAETQQEFTPEEMGFAPETPTMEFPSAPVAAAMTGAPVSGIPAGMIQKIPEWYDKLAWTTPIGLVTEKIPEIARGLISKIPIPSQDKLEAAARSTRQLGIPFGGGFQGMVPPGMSSEEATQRQAAFTGALAEEAKGLAEFTVSPVGLATAAIAGPLAAKLGPVARSGIRRLINAGFTADIARNVPEQYQNWLVAQEQGTPAEQEKADVNLFSSLAMLTGLATHQARGVPQAIGALPDVWQRARELGLERTTAQVAAKAAEAVPAKAPAVEIISKSTLLGKDQYRVKAPGIGGETIIMVDEGAPLSEVQAKWVERWKEYQEAPEAPAVAASKVAKAPEAAERVRTPAEAAKAPEPQIAESDADITKRWVEEERLKRERAEAAFEASRESKPMPIISQVERSSAEEFRAMADKDWKDIGGLTGKAYEVGRNVKSQAEVDQLKVALDRATAESSANIKHLVSAPENQKESLIEHSQILALKKQFFNEAHGAATGTGSAGRRLRDKDPNYKPPFPIEQKVGDINALQRKEAQAPVIPGPVTVGTPPVATEAAAVAPPAAPPAAGGVPAVQPMPIAPEGVAPPAIRATPWTMEDVAEYVKISNTPSAEGKTPTAELEALMAKHGGNPPPIQQVTKVGELDASKEQGAVGVVGYTPAPGIEAVAKGTPSRLRESESPREKETTEKVIQPSPAAVANIEPVPGAPPVPSSPITPQPPVPGIMSKWLSATADRPLGSEAGFFTLEPIKEIWERYTPAVKDAIQAVRDVYSENRRIQPTTDSRRALLAWSGKMQTSFNEAAHAQREIETKARNPVRRDAITNWIEAGGDRSILQQRLDATKSWVHPVTGKPHPNRKNLVAGYEAALNLTPEEIAVAADVRRVYEALGRRGFDNEILKNFKDNYITHIWNMARGAARELGRGAGGRTLKERFQFAKARTFDTFFDGEQAGWVPKTKDVAKLLPAYMHEMNSVIASRQLVAQFALGKARDGRPILAAEGIGFPIEGEKGKATLILPDFASKEYRDYVKFPKQPALHAWRWATKDSDGKPVFIRANLAVHPKVAPYLNAALGKSRIREWYRTRTSASAEIPKALVHFADWSQSETKRTMLGLLAPFHQVQEGTHAWGHRVNPFWGNPTLDLANNPAQRDAVRHGVMLAPDMASKDMFMEGFRHSGLVSKIPGIGPIADRYSNYLFHDYIPGLKFRTYEKILERNSHVCRDELSSGKLSIEDVKILSAEQTNAAYGHLNYADLGRSPTMQHFMRLTLLAPDFLEARMRFTGQAIKGLGGQKVGREQIIAVGFLAASQAVTAYTMAQLTGGQWDWKDPFAFHVGNRKFTMRSVPEDLLRLGQDPRAFIYARLSPLIGRGAVQYLSRTDWRGRKVTGAETAKELAMQPIPLTLRALLDTANSPLSEWEQILASAGIIIKRYSALSEIRKKAHDWMYESADPRIKAAEVRFRQETFADSDYKAMREALINNDYKEAAGEYAKLLETKTAEQIDRTMTHPRPMTGNSAWDVKFKASLSPEDKILYEQALKERKELMERYAELKSSMRGAGLKSAPLKMPNISK